MLLSILCIRGILILFMNLCFSCISLNCLFLFRAQWHSDASQYEDSCCNFTFVELGSSTHYAALRFILRCSVLRPTSTIHTVVSLAVLCRKAAKWSIPTYTALHICFWVPVKDEKHKQVQNLWVQTNSCQRTMLGNIAAICIPRHACRRM